MQSSPLQMNHVYFFYFSNGGQRKGVAGLVALLIEPDKGGTAQAAWPFAPSPFRHDSAIDFLNLTSSSSSLCSWLALPATTLMIKS